MIARLWVSCRFRLAGFCSAEMVKVFANDARQTPRKYQTRFLGHS